jgi:hypothetical protein
MDEEIGHGNLGGGRAGMSRRKTRGLEGSEPVTSVEEF